jgi:hypothetical protein
MLCPSDKIKKNDDDLLQIASYPSNKWTRGRSQTAEPNLGSADHWVPRNNAVLEC